MSEQDVYNRILLQIEDNWCAFGVGLKALSHSYSESEQDVYSRILLQIEDNWCAF